MSVKTQCTIYTHLVTRRGSCCIEGIVINRSYAGIGPGNPGWVFKYDCLYLAATVVLSSLIGKTFQKKIFFFVCLVWQTKFFTAQTLWRNYIRNISIYLQQLNSLVCMSPVIFLYKYKGNTHVQYVFSLFVNQPTWIKFLCPHCTSKSRREIKTHID